MPSKKPDLLRQNAELRPHRIWNFSLPAWVVKRPDGTSYNVCPQAGACASLCYARQGTYLFPVVRQAHLRNLELTIPGDNGFRDFVTQMFDELERKKFRPNGIKRLPDLPRHHLHPHVAHLLDNGAAAIRIHDSGDFHNTDYLHAWVAIAAEYPDILFYAYTKEVSRFKALLERSAALIPPNFLWVYSLGGKEDHLLDLTTDRHAEVFPDKASLEAAGYYSQEDNDLLSVVAPSNRVGIISNQIPAFRKRQGEQTFGQLERGTTRHSRRAVEAHITELPGEQSGAGPVA